MRPIDRRRAWGAVGMGIWKTEKARRAVQEVRA